MWRSGCRCYLLLPEQFVGPLYNHKQARLCYYDVSPACVVAEVEGSRGPGIHVSLFEHTKEPDAKAHFQGWFQETQTSGKGPQPLDEVMEDGEALM